MSKIQSIELITTDSKVRGGKPCIVGTGIRVMDVVMAHLFHRRTPDEISSEYDVSLAQVYAALAYYYEHKTTIDEDIRRQVGKAQEQKGKRLVNGSSLLPG